MWISQSYRLFAQASVLMGTLFNGRVEGPTKEKKEDAEKNESVEMSKNAQFRAIKPSPSILSFVEDNFLGRRRLIELRRAGYNTELSAPLDNIPSSTSIERERIEEPVKEYVSTRVGLKQVCLLIDTKWGMKPRVHELIDLMERYGSICLLVFTLGSSDAYYCH
ncbi:hypothetical protein RHMOL_Rhmol09G0168600 [Rhododendron molle]|uniref:Uncharacterized protein n=1 Tax=Rhododendron molle TaxID=49168 RepID=A0ACC0MEJ2_RHOML|nr:hypothetical protein RHMOL_Rhmol09G0168600 [Rhododendron molle]